MHAQKLLKGEKYVTISLITRIVDEIKIRINASKFVGKQLCFPTNLFADHILVEIRLKMAKGNLKFPALLEVVI